MEVLGVQKVACKNVTVNILCFVGPPVSVPTTHLCTVIVILITASKYYCSTIGNGLILKKTCINSFAEIILILKTKQTKNRALVHKIFASIEQ